MRSVAENWSDSPPFPLGTPCPEVGEGLHSPVQRHCESLRVKFAGVLQTVKAEPFRTQVNSSQGGCPCSQAVSLCQRHNS